MAGARRWCLLREPGGIEGVRSLVEAFDSGDLAIPKCVHDPPSALHRDLAVARTAPLEDFVEHFVARIGEVAGFDRVPGEGLDPRREPLLGLPLVGTRSGISGLVTNTKSSVTSSNQRLKSPWAVRSTIARTISTFSCDIAYSASPAASRASSRVSYWRARAILPSRSSYSVVNSSSTRAPLPSPMPHWRLGTKTQSPASM